MNRTGKKIMPRAAAKAPQTATARISRSAAGQRVSIALPNGALMETRLKQDHGKAATSAIYYIAASGRQVRWKPGRQYAGGSMWHVDGRGNIYGFDFNKPRRVYICRMDGRHVATLILFLHRKSLLRPTFFRTGVRGIRFSAGGGKREFLSWDCLARRLRRRRGAAYAAGAMAWLTGRTEAARRRSAAPPEAGKRASVTLEKDR